MLWTDMKSIKMQAKSNALIVNDYSPFENINNETLK
jgi:hypothetical protein